MKKNAIDDFSSEVTLDRTQGRPGYGWLVHHLIPESDYRIYFPLTVSPLNQTLSSGE